MKILAITTPGKEFIYSVMTAHKVSARNGHKIMNAINEARYKLKDGEVWHMYDVNEYDRAYDVGQFQNFTIRKGKLYETEF